MIYIFVQVPTSATTEQYLTKWLKLKTGIRDPLFNDLLKVISHLKHELYWEEIDFIKHLTGKDLLIVQ
ncbi:hypothetical protein RclHR1_08410016 [Rhizophagus clarus]|nr:hypothetical protein RclHR1_08410016 [Rhizophagus clarus]